MVTREIIRTFFAEMFAPWFETVWAARMSLIAVILLAIFLLITLFETVVSWHQDFLLTHQKTILSDNQENVMQSIAAIPKEHLFGSPLTSSGFIPITSLQLRLIGITQFSDERLSRVMISENGQSGKIYAVGDSLPSGIRINHIESDGVILENAGHLEKLPLQRSTLSFQNLPTGIFS